MQDVQPDFSTQEGCLRLARLYRYAQVGGCVSSVTHDVNNLLGAILAYTELIGLEGGLSSEANRMLGEIMEAVRRASVLVNNLTDIARRERPDTRIVQPAQLFERVLSLRRYDLKVARVDVSADFDESLPSIAVDLPKIEQALIYVLTNAIEGLEQEADKRIRLGVDAPNGRVEFSIWNAGPAIETDEQVRIFEPFYTTKGGDHLGLGLWIARNAAQANGGDIFYEPARGFVLSLPRKSPSGL